MSRVKFSNQKKSYMPSDSLAKLMTNFRQIELDGLEVDRKERTKEITKPQADKERKALKVRRRNQARLKVEVLNKHIFPAMANLTIFLESMMDSPYIRDTFERDLIALFFAKSKSTLLEENKKDETIFGRFIKACGISMKNKLRKEDIPGTRYVRFESVPEHEGGGLEPIQDFRFLLWEIMMRKIWDMLPAAGQYKLKDNAFLNNILYADFGRAFSCISLLAQEAREHLEFDEDRRPALF